MANYIDLFDKKFSARVRTDNGTSFTMITNRVAIGDYTSDYSSFDIIVNLNFPDNKVEHGYLNKMMIESNKILYRCGIYDSPQEDIGTYINSLIPELLRDAEGKRILFHCFAGISRSSSMCIAYLGKISNTSYTDTYNYVKSKRPCIQPNSGFVKNLISYLDK